MACTFIALAGALAGCGSSSPTGTSADPASVTPAASAVYVGAVIRPSGSLKSAAVSAGTKLTSQSNPYTRLLGLLQTPGSPTLDYSRDVAPWLGPNAGLFVTSLGSSESLTNLLEQGLSASGGSSAGDWPFIGSGTSNGGSASSAMQGAIVLDTSDLSAAKTFVDNADAHAGAHSTSYRGVSYEATSSGDAFAIVDKFVVLGTEAGVHAVIETAQGGASLGSNSTYASLQAVAPTGALGHVYANSAALGSALSASAAHSGGSSASQGLPTLVRTLSAGRPLNVSLVPSASALTLDADAGPASTGAAGTRGGGSASGGLVAAVAAGSTALGELPGESWLAAGLGNIGANAGGSLGGIHSLLGLIGTLGSSGAGEGVATQQTALSVKGLLEGLLTPLSLMSANTAHARSQFLNWMGDAGVFASGTSVLELKGGVVIDSNNAAASRSAVGALATDLRKAGQEASTTHIAGTEAAIEAKISGLPLTLVIASGPSATGQTKFVLGLGQASIQDALHPASTLSTASTYASAASALGEGIKPSIAVDFSTLLNLLETVGLAENPTIKPFLPYLRNSSTLYGGGKSLGGGIERLRLVLNLQ
jgi:hypothetical protein